MIKLVVFDLDGVLVESKDLHYNALNQALQFVSDEYVISHDEHIKHYDGLPTKKKLQKLSDEKGLPVDSHKLIWNAKQEKTIDIIWEKTEPNYKIIQLFKELKEDGYKIWIASNSIRKTVWAYIITLGLGRYIDGYVSNQDVLNAKPHPEMYTKCMNEEKVLPQQTLIIEDSQVGITAAKNSGAHVLRVSSPEDVTADNIYRKLEKLKKVRSHTKWEGGKMNILVPMAGAGSRFAQAGYTFPKPLIEINGKPMIQVVVESIGIEGQYIYVVQAEHEAKYNLMYLLNIITPGCKVVIIDRLTEGAACTTLLAKALIDNDSPLLICNSDQYIDYEPTEFMYFCEAGNLDGCVMTFENTHPKWSYVKVENEYITEVAEKKVISNHATVGIYYWRRGSDYVKYAEQMIAKNIRTNNEFYVAPVINEAIVDGKLFARYPIQEMWGLGTPEDLARFNSR